MKYLTKIIDNTTYHFRINTESNGVYIVEGIFYKSMTKGWEACAESETPKEKLKRIVQDKLNNGFKISRYKEIPENTLNIYDKVKWHFDDIPKNLNVDQAYVHTGMYLGWLIEKNLISNKFESENLNLIEAFKCQEITGPQLFQSLDGNLFLDDLNETGNRFSLKYFEFEKGDYLNDYLINLAVNLPSMYHVQDTWTNYRIVRKFVNKRFNEWLNSKDVNKSFKWAFWK